jgi:ferredoxin-NADP reductase
MLFFSVRTPRDVIYDRSWRELSAAHANFRCHLTATRAQPDEWSGRRGRLSAEWIREAEGDVSDCVTYICGPGPMVEASSAVCRQLSIPDDNVNVEKW